MAGKIPKTFIDNLVAQADIVDVISQYVAIKKKGSNYSACCPFHDEKTPSFSVSPAKQFYYCFGCGAHGDAIGFIKEYNNLSFVEAVEELARQLGVDVPREVAEDSRAAQQRNVYQQLYDVLAQAAKLFQWHLRQPIGKAAASYCQTRGLTGDIAKLYGLGFAPAGWDNVAKAIDPKNKKADLLLQAGLSVKNDKGRVYDRFRNRLMFPIRDRRGRVIGFGGRVIDPQDQPKYLNSPETPVFHKGKELYGLYEARQSQKQLDYVLVVEGYMDVIALAQAGIPNAVATMGTATTLEHLRILFKETEQVVFCFDGDQAGKQAGWRALTTALPLMTGEYEIKFLFLPDGEDPDSLVRQEGKAAFQQRIAAAQPLGEFLLAALAKTLDLNRADGRAKYISKVLPYLKQMPEGSMHTVLLNVLAERCQVPVGQITTQLFGKGKVQSMALQPASVNTFSLVEKAIHYLVRQPDLMQGVAIPNWYTDDENVSLLVSLMDYVSENNPRNTGAIIAQWPKPSQAKRLAELAAIHVDVNPDINKQEFVDLICKIDQAFETQSLEKLLEKSKHYTLSATEKEKITQLLRKVKKN